MKASLFYKITAYLLLSVSPIAAQEDSVVNKIIELGRKDNKTMEHLDVLTNRIGGRLLGSDAYENATYWAAGLFKKWGIEVEVKRSVLFP